jgi:hypothetical protein
MARHLRTAPTAPPDTSFPWALGTTTPRGGVLGSDLLSGEIRGTAGPGTSTTTVHYRRAAGRHCLAAEFEADAVRPGAPPLPARPSARRAGRRTQHAGASGPPDAALPTLPVRPRRAPEAIRLPLRPAERPDLDTIRRVLAALYRL